MNLDGLPEDKVCLFQMRHLRMMDAVISRGLSFERTVYMFFVSIELDERLNVFKRLKNVVVLLDRVGALRKKDGKWAVIFAPQEVEGQTIEPEEPLFPIFDDMRKRARREGEMTTLPLSDIPIRALLNNRFHIDFLDTYCSHYPGGYLAVAQNIVINGPEELFKNVPVCSYGLLTTVDHEEIEDFHTIKELLDDYALQGSLAGDIRLKPLTIAVFGAPGSGKSFGINQIAKSAGTFETHTLNLSQFKSYDDMSLAFERALHGDPEKTPLIFFDEFDSDYQGTPRGWLKYLLAPMQDGEFNCNGKTISIQRAVLVFAGGTTTSFTNFLPKTAEEEAVFKKIKGPDFVSRLKGTLNIKGPNPSSITDKSYIIRRALSLRDLIKRKVPSIYDEDTGVINISRGLLGALLRVSTYKHGNRSMEFILDMSRLTGVTKYLPASLPPKSQMEIHMDTDDFFQKLSSIRIHEDTFEIFCMTVHHTRVKKALANAKGDKKSLMAIKKNHDMQDWGKLSEETKEEYRAKLRHMLERMSSTEFPLGIRPKGVKKAKDTIKEMNQEELRLYARLDYEEWLHQQKANGWLYGEKLDKEVKISPLIKDWDTLSEKEKVNIMGKVKSLPFYLNVVDLELYRKPF